jgi:hypothetical protein
MWRRILITVLFVILLFAGPLGWSYLTYKPPARHWYAASHAATGLSPDTTDAVLQVFVAPTFGWRGAFAVHSWLAIKPAGTAVYDRIEVIGWGVSNGTPAIRQSQGNPDGLWFGSKPKAVLDLRGAEAARLIHDVRAAIASYPYPKSYRVWPGPNSNTFTAHIAREVPELGLSLPVTAVGKDFLTHERLFAQSPSGTGWQVSVQGLAGVTVGLKEGVELNLLGFSAGLAVWPPALKLPGVGHIGME